MPKTNIKRLTFNGRLMFDKTLEIWKPPAIFDGATLIVLDLQSKSEYMLKTDFKWDDATKEKEEIK